MDSLKRKSRWSQLSLANSWKRLFLMLFLMQSVLRST